MRSVTGLSLALLAVFLCTPFALDARSPDVLRLNHSRLSTRGTIGRIQVAARLDSGAGERLRVQLTAVNPTDKPQVAHLRVEVLRRAPMSRMARMMPPPIEAGHAVLTVELKPRERFVKSVPLVAPGAKGGHVRLSKGQRTGAWLALRPATAPKAARAAARHVSRQNRAVPRGAKARTAKPVQATAGRLPAQAAL